MTKYVNEASFSRALVNLLRKKGWFVQRIESGTTGKGIPDIYAISPHNRAVWLELKRIPYDLRISHGEIITVPWRPGQQAWLYEATKRGQNCLTVVATLRHIVLIPHLHPYPHNKVYVMQSGIVAGGITQAVDVLERRLT